MGSSSPLARLAPRTGMPPADDGDDDLIAQFGAEVAEAMSAALERVTALATTGRIDRSSLRLLREDIELARRVGMMAQQVSRFASGRVRLHHERLDLSAMLREALLQRGREMQARGLEVRQLLQPAQVRGDATLTFSLLQALLDWSFEHACSRIDLSLDLQTWPVHARLRCGFAHRPADEVSSAHMALEPGTLDTVSWRLVQQTAHTLGIALSREDHAGRTHVTLDFDQTVVEPIDGVSAVALDDPLEAGANSQPLAGSHVLVLAATRELRNLVREAVRPMGLMVDFVASVDEAREFCREGLPHAVVHDEALAGPAFDALKRELQADVPTLAFIQITALGKAFELRQVGERTMASVGRSAVVQALPSALQFELSRCAP